MRTPSTRSFRFLTPVLGIVAAAASGGSQPGVPRPPGLVNEEMWPAATAEEWKRPVLIEWQRTWDDAVLLSKQSSRPILVCINMDGEIASEHYAGVRYRQPEITKLYAPYVCVIASVYRHTPRDHDAQGHRVPCPRFGGVTCGEHIAMEAIAFEKFMNGERIAPRHIMVELDQQETFDVYYTWDTASVFTTITEGITKRPIPTPPVVRGDSSLLERVASPDSHDRSEVERAWQQADPATRRALFEAAVRLGGDAPVELLRLAIFGLDSELATKARQSLAQANSVDAVDLVASTMRGPLTVAERDALIDALGRLATSSPKARMLASVHRGLAQSKSVLDVEQWSRALVDAAPAPSLDAGAIAARADYHEAVARAQPDDAAAQMAHAESTLLQALTTPATSAAGNQRAARAIDRLRLQDAQRIARQAEQLGAKGWRLHAVLAVTSVQLGAIAEAYAFAEAAMTDLPPQAEDRLAAELLALFAEARQDAIAKAARAKQDWPPQHVADVNAAYTLLARHPFGTAVHVGHHYDFLQFFGAALATRVLDEGLARFPAAAALHERLRARIIEEKGADALEAAYAERIAAENASPAITWFAGYAALVAAEYHRRGARTTEALTAYDRGIALYERYAQLEDSTDADHFVAMALAGKARIRLQEGDLARALGELEASLQRREAAAASPDGLGITAVDTAKMLLTRLQAAPQKNLAERLASRLAALDPVLLEPPEYERAIDDRRGQRRRRGR